MHTVNLSCDVPPDRTLVVKLPESVPPGRHEIVVLIDAPTRSRAFRELSPEEQRDRLAGVQTRWRHRLSSSAEFAAGKQAEIEIEKGGTSDG